MSCQLKPPSAGTLAPLGFAALAFGLYLRTAARTITWAHLHGADGAELSTAAAVLGVPHPPGFPLYTLLGHLFTWLPVGEVAFRVALLSAVAGAAAVGLAAALAARLSAGPAHAPAVAGAGSGQATGPLFWSQATIPETYTLHVALALAALTLLAAWRPGDDRRLWTLAGLLGLGMGNHVTLALLAGPGALYLLACEPGLLRRRAGLLAAAAFCAGLLIYAYLPLRAAADPPLNWGDPDTPARFLAHVTGSAYHGYLGGRPLLDVAARAPVMARLVAEQLTWPGLLLALVGFGELARLRPPLARLLLLYLGLTLLFTLLYNAEGAQVYLLPVVAVLAVCLGIGAAQLAGLRRGRLAALGLVAAIGFWQVVSWWPEMDLSEETAAAAYARATLQGAAPAAVLLTERDEQTFPLWYTQIVEGQRPDVAIVDRRLLAFDWYRAQLERRFPGVLDRLPR